MCALAMRMCSKVESRLQSHLVGLMQSWQHKFTHFLVFQRTVPYWTIHTVSICPSSALWKITRLIRRILGSSFNDCLNSQKHNSYLICGQSVSCPLLKWKEYSHFNPSNTLHCVISFICIYFSNEGLIPSNYVTENERNNLEAYE